MHFWIDKRSQICGYNGRYAVPPSLASGRRHKLVTPVHRFRAIENGMNSHQSLRTCQQSASESGGSSRNRFNECQRPASNNDSSNTSSAIPNLNAISQINDSGYIDTPIENALNTVSHAQLMRLGSLTKYGMWASFGLTTISVAATKFYVDHQGTFEILLLCTLGVVGAGFLISCMITVYKRNLNSQILNVQTPLQSPPALTTELVIPDTANSNMIITPQTLSSRQSTIGTRANQEAEQCPPPYDIAISLPVRDFSVGPDYPPPSYENAVR